MPVWAWVASGTGAVLIVISAMVTPWVHEIYMNRNEPKPNEHGATEEWATGELAVIVKEISLDRELGNTKEVDMAALRTKLELEDVEIAVKQRSEKILGNIITVLTDDVAWNKQLVEAQKRKRNAKN